MTGQGALWGDGLGDRHDLGDHRGCEAHGCDHAARWHGPVLAAAERACTDSGDPIAVLCIACPPDADGLPRVIGTAPTAWLGTGIRNRHAARGPHGNLYDDGPNGPDDWHTFKGIVHYVEHGEIR